MKDRRNSPSSPAGEFNGGGSYPTSSKGTKRTSELPNPKQGHFRFINEKVFYWEGSYYELPEKTMKEVHGVLDKYVN